MNYEILLSKFKTEDKIKEIVSKELGINFFKNLNKVYSTKDIVNTFLDVDLICSLLEDYKNV
jgi:hypothetical protein